MRQLKKLLRRSPKLSNLISLARFLRQEAWFAAWARIAPKRFMDESHLRRSWDFDNPYSKEWHNRVLAVIAARMGEERWGDALEIGCSEGVFTSYLSSRCRSVDAYDISPIAQKRAIERCAQFSNVRIGLLDLAKNEIPGQYDLVFAMDILSCIRGRRRLARAVTKLTNALREGGVLIYTDNSMPLDVLRSWGNHPWWGPFFAMMEPDDCVRFLQSRFPLQLVSREQYVRDSQGGRDQLIALFRKGATPVHPAAVESLEDWRAGVVASAGHTE